MNILWIFIFVKHVIWNFKATFVIIDHFRHFSPPISQRIEHYFCSRLISTSIFTISRYSMRKNRDYLVSFNGIFFCWNAASSHSSWLFILILIRVDDISTTSLWIFGIHLPSKTSKGKQFKCSLWGYGSFHSTNNK